MKSLHIIILLLAVAVFAAALFATYGPRAVVRFVLEPFEARLEHFCTLGIVPTPKSVIVLQAKSYTAAGTALSAALDTAGFDYATIDVALGTADTTAHQPTVLKLSESDDTTTTVTDIVAFTGGTALSASVGYVIPAADTSNPQIVKMNIDLKKRKRYLRLAMTAATVQLVHAQMNLHKAEQSPVSASDAGAAVLAVG